MTTKTTQERVEVMCGKARLEASLVIPPRPHGVILAPFPGGNTGRASSREAHIAAALREAGFAILLSNLLTHGEDRLSTLRHNIKLLAQRIVGLSHWLREEPRLSGLPLGYLASGNTAAAAIRAADRLGHIVRAVVVRSGRPDLAGAVPLGGLSAATLLIVGEHDHENAAPNRQAYEHMQCRRELLRVPQASQFFDEPGTLDFAARYATGWMSRWLPQPCDDSATAPLPAEPEREHPPGEASVRSTAGHPHP